MALFACIAGCCQARAPIGDDDYDEDDDDDDDDDISELQSPRPKSDSIQRQKSGPASEQISKRNEQTSSQHGGGEATGSVSQPHLEDFNSFSIRTSSF